MNISERKPLNSDLLRTFTIIAEQGHLTAASDMLNRTQSAISVQLRKLEQDLGVTLFTRTPHGMELTPSGEALLPAAHAALDNLTHVRHLFETPLTGKIRVGIPDDFDDFALENVLARFAQRNSKVEVVATSGCTSGFEAMIAKKQLDVAVVSNAHPPAQGHYTVENTVWAAAKSLSFADERRIPLILLDRQCWWKNIATHALESSNMRYRVVFKSSSFSSLKAAIRAGIGVGVLTETSLDPSMQVLTAKDGFPPLPTAHRYILTNPEADETLTTSMVAALEGFALSPPRND